MANFDSARSKWIDNLSQSLVASCSISINSKYFVCANNHTHANKPTKCNFVKTRKLTEEEIIASKPSTEKIIILKNGTKITITHRLNRIERRIMKIINFITTNQRNQAYKYLLQYHQNTNIVKVSDPCGETKFIEKFDGGIEINNYYNDYYSIFNELQKYGYNKL